MPRKLIDEVSIQEMRNMREIEHLSNSEIAERLDVSHATVLKYIGPAGREYRKPRVYKPPMATAKAEDFVPQCVGLLPCGKDEYFVASNRKRICIHNGKAVDIVQMTEEGETPILTGLKRTDVETLVGELKAVLQLMAG